MEFGTVLLLVALVVACPVYMMWMMRRTRGPHDEPREPPAVDEPHGGRAVDRDPAMGDRRDR